MPTANPFSGQSSWSNPFTGMSPIALSYLNEVPDAGWGAYLKSFGGNSDPFGSWLNTQQSRYYKDFQGANSKDQNLTWTNYLQNMDPYKEYQGLDRYTRGENPRNWYGRTKWSL